MSAHFHQRNGIGRNGECEFASSSSRAGANDRLSYYIEKIPWTEHFFAAMPETDAVRCQDAATATRQAPGEQKRAAQHGDGDAQEQDTFAWRGRLANFGE